MQDIDYGIQEMLLLVDKSWTIEGLRPMRPVPSETADQNDHADAIAKSHSKIFWWRCETYIGLVSARDGHAWTERDVHTEFLSLCF
jgi:hypothetical protein